MNNFFATKQSEIEVHPEFLAIWHRALAEIIQLEKSLANFAYVEVSEDVITKKSDNDYQLVSRIAGKPIVFDIPHHFWRVKDSNSDKKWGEVILSGPQDRVCGRA